MAVADERPVAELRRELETERRQLASAVESLKSELGVAEKVRARLPLATAGALAAGFVVAGGIGATVRLLFRRGRE
jgi:hypothetical protein